jgi:integrase
VAQPVEAHLMRLKGRELAKRNPMIYTVRGTSGTREWIDRVLADKETSAIEGLLGTWQEEVARIVSGGVKPASGVDLQIENDETIGLYAIQSAPNTKNAAGSRHDLEALKRAAAVLRNQRRHVDLYVAVLFGRNRTAPLRREPGITVLGSDDFWCRISGVPDFRARLLRATLTLSHLMRERSADEIERIRREAITLYDDGTGNLKIDALANPPRRRPRLEAGIQLELVPRDW